MQAYGTSNLDVDLSHPDECLVEVLDGLCSILSCLVADISNAAMREELDICDRKFGEVLAHIVLGELGRQSAYKDARRLHDVRFELWPAQEGDTQSEKLLGKKVREILASLHASA